MLATTRTQRVRAEPHAATLLDLTRKRTRSGRTGGRVEEVFFYNHYCCGASQVVGLRDRVAIIRALLHSISSPQPYAGYGDLIGVGHRRNLSEAACYRVLASAPVFC